VCGEREHPQSGDARADGSSPRVRGTQKRSSSYSRWIRFIPACAGNALAYRNRANPVTVHPRVCGERLFKSVVHRHQSGSSPRVRGTRGPSFSGGCSPRFIPACAGNARSVIGPVMSHTVHPRVCGERMYPMGRINGCYGSSPRVRGTPGLDVADFLVGRFIPACAGNAGWTTPALTHSSVHPRVCGERAHHLFMLSTAIGSSPRVRGTLSNARGDMPGFRFIPACAGNALARFAAQSEQSVHPRVCGERRIDPGVTKLDNGSSPRVRGTQQ